MGRKITIVALVLVLLAVCAGSIVAVIPVIGAVRSGQVHFGWFSSNNVSASATEEKQATLGPAGSLSVHTPNGKIDVTAMEGTDQAVITAHKTAWGMDSKSADEILQKVIVDVQQTENRVDIEVKYPVEVDLIHIGPAGVAVDFTITVPTGTAVTATTSSGDVSINRTAGITVLRSDFGDLYANNLEGALTAHTSSGRVVVINSGSPQNPMDVSSDFGDVTVHKSRAATLVEHTSSGTVTLTETTVAGKAEVTTDFGDILMKWSNAGEASVKTNSGQITLDTDNVGGALSAGSDFGGILCANTAAGSYDLRTSSGQVEADSLKGNAKVRTSFGDLILSGAGVLLDASTNSGSVTFTGTLAEGRNVLHSDFGGITLYLPEGFQFQADLQTSFGRVHSEFPVTATGTDNGHLVGAVGDSGVFVAASTSSGDVNVRIQAGASVAPAQ